MGTWTILGHELVRRVAVDADRFSSAVSRFVQVPNGMDGAEHECYRALVDGYLTSARVMELEPRCEAIVADLVAELPRVQPVEAVRGIGARCAVRFQIDWLGWSKSLEPLLLAWIDDYRGIVASGDDVRHVQIAARFDAIIRGELAARRADQQPCNDVTAELMRDTVNSMPLSDDEIVSILRNWTAGDLGSLAASVGIIVHRLATHADLQNELRTRSIRLAAGDEADRPAFDRALDEILRIDDPFLRNRRIATCDVELDGHVIPKGSKVELVWTAANRDPAIFHNPDAYQPDENSEHNLVYGIGPHICPGRALATMELRVITAALLRATTSIELAPEAATERSIGGIGGFRSVRVLLH